MTREDRAVLAFRVAGMVLLAWALGGLVDGVCNVLAVVPSGGRLVSSVSLVSAICEPPVVYLVLGVISMTWARRIARRLLTPRRPDHTPACETLRIGFMLIGLGLLVHAANVVLPSLVWLVSSVGGSGSIPDALQLLAVALYYVGAGALLALLSGRLGRRFSDQVPGLRGVAAALILLLCTCAFLYAVPTLASLAIRLAHISGDDAFAEVQDHWWIATVTWTGAVVLPLLGAAIRRPIAWYAVSTRGESAPNLRTGGLSLADGTATAIGIVLAYAMVFHVAELIPAESLSWNGLASLVAALWRAALIVAAAFPVAWLAGHLAFGVTGGLRFEPPDRWPVPAPAVLVLDVGLAVVLLGSAVQYAAAAIFVWSHYHVAGPWVRADGVVPAGRGVILGLLLLLALRGGLVRVSCRAGGDPEDVPGPEREAALSLWCAMLGVWLVLTSGALVLRWVVRHALLGGWLSVPNLAGVAGLLLFLCARPVARLLSGRWDLPARGPEQAGTQAQDDGRGDPYA